MTCIEKLRKLNPWVTDGNVPECIKSYCPSEFGIMANTKGCHAEYEECVACWNREVPEENRDIPEKKHNLHKLEVEITGETVQRLNRLAVRLEKPYTDVVEAALLLYEDALDAVEAGRDRVDEMYIVGESRS